MENENAQLVINGQGKMFLLESAKWAKFLAIIAFVFLGLLTLLGILMLVMPSMLPHGSMTVPMVHLGKAFFVLYGMFMLIISIINFIPTYYLYQFAVRTRTAVVSNNETVMTESLEWLKKRFKFMGIMTIVVICVYVLIAVIAGLAAAF